MRLSDSNHDDMKNIEATEAAPVVSKHPNAFRRRQKVKNGWGGPCGAAEQSSTIHSET